MADEFKALADREYKLVTNGYDEEDISPLPLDQLDEYFTISHIGSINASRNPAELWKVLAAMVKANQAFAEKLRIKLVGKVDIDVIRDIEANGLANNFVRIEYMPHREVMKEIQKSQVLLLLINNTPNAKGILTGKVFEYLGSGRPILSIGPEDGDAAEILNETAAGKTADYSNEDRMRLIIEAYFSKFLEQALEGNKTSSAKFSRKALTGQIAGVLEEMINLKKSNS
jgi:hypothetical protein